MTSPSIACQQLVEMVTDYLEECLTAEDMAAVQRHLQACADCSGYLTQMREVQPDRIAHPAPGLTPHVGGHRSTVSVAAGPSLRDAAVKEAST